MITLVGVLVYLGYLKVNGHMKFLEGAFKYKGNLFRNPFEESHHILAYLYGESRFFMYHKMNEDMPFNFFAHHCNERFILIQNRGESSHFLLTSNDFLKMLYAFLLTYKYDLQVRTFLFHLF